MGSLLIAMWHWVSTLQLLLSWSLDPLWSSAVVCTRLDSVVPKQVGKFCCWFQLGVGSGFSCVISQKLGLLRSVIAYACVVVEQLELCILDVLEMYAASALVCFLDSTKFRNIIYRKNCNLVCVSPQLKIQTISPNSRTLLWIISLILVTFMF